MSYISNYNTNMFKEVRNFTGFSNKSQKIIKDNGLDEKETSTLEKILKKTSEMADKKIFSTNLCYKPMKILNTLSKLELKVLKKAHNLPDEIDIDSLDYEQAYNLLTEPGSGEDLDEDGYIGLGNSKIFEFPPADSSESFKAAWEKATVGKTDKEIMSIKLSFIPESTKANIKYDENGKEIGIYKEEDPEYTNIYSQKGFSYQKMMSNYRNNLNLCKYMISSGNYNNKLGFINSLQNFYSSEA